MAPPPDTKATPFLKAVSAVILLSACIHDPFSSQTTPARSFSLFRSSDLFQSSFDPLSVSCLLLTEGKSGSSLTSPFSHPITSAISSTFLLLSRILPKCTINSSADAIWFPNGCQRQVRRHQHHRLKACYHIPRTVAVPGGNGTVMACIHGLGISGASRPSSSPHQNPVRSHSETRPD